MVFHTFIRNITLLTFEEVQTAHPSGVYSEEHGCYFFVDHDGDLGYFIQYSNEEFESEPQWADLDTLADDERIELETIMNHILVNQ
jgi:hypothetical protein